MLSQDLLFTQQHVFVPLGLTCSNIHQETESTDYGACSFVVTNMSVMYRDAKITPKKLGLFVTFWKRQKGIIVPHDHDDPFDLLLVSVRKGERLGQFVFPKAALFKQAIISYQGKGGKLAMRVYPPWELVTSQQAKKTQQWQSHYFFEIQPTTQIKKAYELVNSLMIKLFSNF